MEKDKDVKGKGYNPNESLGSKRPPLLSKFLLEHWCS